MTKWLDSLQPSGALLMRLVLGISMAVHGYQKVIPHSALSHYLHYIASLHIPYWLGYISAYTEFLGGLFLILGLFTRLTAALVAVDMLIAFVYVGVHQGFDLQLHPCPRRTRRHVGGLRRRSACARSQNRFFLISSNQT